MLKLGAIGHGHWGVNVVRHFSFQPDCDLLAIGDRNPKAVAKAMSRYPTASVTCDPDDVVTSPEIDAVAIATPAATHYELARRALEHGKHVFVASPFTLSSRHAEELIDLAEGKRLVIMVDHTPLFSGAVRKIKELVDGGGLGPLAFYDSTRVSGGLLQHDVNVIWSLGPDDIAIADYLIGAEPELVVANGGAPQGGMADMAHLSLYFAKHVIAYVNVNRLAPVRVRTAMIGAQRKTVVWNDLEPAEQVKVYDKGSELGTAESLHRAPGGHRSGEMWAPLLDEAEPLQVETRYFLDCVSSGNTPFNDGRAGLRVVKILEAADQSLKRRRETVFAAARRSDPRRSVAPNRPARAAGG